MLYLRYMCLFAHSGVQDILDLVCGLFVFVLCVPCCRFLWIVHFGVLYLFADLQESIVMSHIPPFNAFLLSLSCSQTENKTSKTIY